METMSVEIKFSNLIIEIIQLSHTILNTLQKVFKSEAGGLSVLTSGTYIYLQISASAIVSFLVTIGGTMSGGIIVAMLAGHFLPKWWAKLWSFS